MLCKLCNKRQATVHITEIVNSKMVEMHLCEVCAEKKGMLGTQSFGLADLLSGLMDLGVKMGKEEKEILKSCSECGMTFEDFKKTGRFGCTKCYQAFEETIYPLLQKIHGARRHTGKYPKKVAKGTKQESQLEQLQVQLKTAVEQEDFEEAAKLRDKMKALQKNKK